MVVLALYGYVVVLALPGPGLGPSLGTEVKSAKRGTDFHVFRSTEKQLNLVLILFDDRKCGTDTKNR